MVLSLAARYGLHRVLDSDGNFPQPAWKTMLIGNGHMPDMGLTALNVLRESPAVRAVFERRYAP
jgi:hypothetical protein